MRRGANNPTDFKTVIMGEKIISEATPVRVGLVIMFLGAFGGAVWWASAVSTDLKTLVVGQASIVTAYSGMNRDMTDWKVKTTRDNEAVVSDVETLKTELRQIRDQGSPITDKRLTLIERQLENLKPKQP